jgi:diketogulonate reductase-like aldo/keto reductase
VDLYLIHWPVQGIGNNTTEIWKAMVHLLKEGKARGIGVSNFAIDDLKQILNDSDVVPAVNQVEFHPFLYQKDLLSFCKKNGIQLEAYSPLTRAKRLNHPTIMNIAKKYHNKTPAQILVRWSLQHNLVVIPKSVHEERILENSQVFDFELEDEDMKHLDSLNENLQTVFLD